MDFTLRRCLAFALLAVGLLCTMPALASAQASNIYVKVCANNGNGTALSCAASPGGAGAYNSIQSAFDDATTPGDHVLIDDGTYDCTSDGSGDSDTDGGCYVKGSGTSTDPIVITFATTARGPVIRNASTSTPTLYSQANNPTITFSGREYITIRGLTIQGSLRAFNPDFVNLAGLKNGYVIEGNEITRGWGDPDDGNWHGVWIDGCRFSSVRGNYIHDITNSLTGAGLQSSLSGIKIYSCIDSTYEYNTILNAYPVSGESHAGGIDDKQDSIRNIHRYNDIKGVQNCLRFQNQQVLGNATGTVAYGNLCRLGAASGVRYAVEIESGGFTDLAVYNNTFAGAWAWGVHFTTSVAAAGLSLYNNAFRGPWSTANIDTDGGANVGTDAWTTLDYNFYYDANYRPRSSVYSSLALLVAGETYEDHGCEVAVTAACVTGWLFTNEGSDVYTLQAGSSLKNAGRTGGTSGGSAVDVGYTGATSCVGHLCTGSGWSDDTTAPVVAITSPTSATTLILATLTTVLSGTCSDESAVNSVTWSNSAGGSGTATGTTSWSVASVTLARGLNTITVTCTDASSNTHQDALTITYQPSQIRSLRIR